MAITFAVDDVAPATTRLATGPLAQRLGGHMALGTPCSEVIETSGVHPLLAAVHVAFAEHRPLVLSPDAIWLAIAQGVAQHVRLNAEALRPRLVRHAGTRELNVLVVGRPSSPEDWQQVVGELRGLLAEMIGDGRARLLTCDFSTTTPEARVASEIVLMDVFAPYCEYVLTCICGIPEVTLSGTPEDWRAIRARIDVIAELDLGAWVRSLGPIADQLVATAEGRVDRAFWRDIYKPREAYGGDLVTGWVARLFPYVQGQGSFDRPNPLLDHALGELPPDREGSRSPWYEGPGIRTDDVSMGTSQVLLNVIDQGAGGGDAVVILEGGLLGVSQDAAGRLEPVAGWLVRPGSASMEALLRRLRVEAHALEAVRPTSWRPTGSVEIVTLFRELHAATLFEGNASWRLRPAEEHDRIEVPLPNGRALSVVRVLDLPDGTCVALAQQIHPETPLVRLRTEQLEMHTRLADVPEPIRIFGGSQGRTTQPASDVPVLEGTLTEVLTRALDTGGNTDLPTTGKTLLDVAPEWILTLIPTKEERESRRQERRERRARDKKTPPTG